MKVKVCATQMKISSNRDENINKAVKMIRECAKAGGNIILLQELFMGLYFCQKEKYEFFDLAIDKNDNVLNVFKDLAKELHVVLPISFFEKQGNCYYNTIKVFDADGSDLGIYRKTHIPTGECYEEKFYFTPGDTGFKVFKTMYGNIGVGICWDQWFVEAARCMTLMGAEILMYPTAIGSEPVLPKDSSIHWQNVMRGHAAGNIIPVFASNRVGEETIDDSSMTFYGCSFICDQHGEKVCELSKTEEGYLIYEFNLNEINDERRNWGIFRDRRPEMYKAINSSDCSK